MSCAGCVKVVKKALEQTQRISYHKCTDVWFALTLDSASDAIRVPARQWGIAWTVWVYTKTQVGAGN